MSEHTRDPESEMNLCVCGQVYTSHSHVDEMLASLTAELAAAREETTGIKLAFNDRVRVIELQLEEAHDVTLQVMSNAIHERDAARADCARLLGLLIDVHGDRQQCNVCLAWTDQPGQAIQHVSDCEVPSVLAAAAPAQAAPSDD